MHFQINSPRIVHETLDNEVIAIDFNDGSYYNIRGVGAVIWLLIDQGASVDQTVAQIKTNFQAQDNDIKADVEKFIDQLCESNLIVSRPDAPANTSFSIDQNSIQTPYKMPEVEHYTDLQQLLLLDPIHEVDQAAGWPLPIEE